MNARPAIASIALSLALCACGNKGALVRPAQVPGENPTDQSMPSPPAAEPDNATVPEALPETPPIDEDGNG